MVKKTSSHSCKKSDKKAQRIAKLKYDLFKGQKPPESKNLRTLFIIYHIAGKLISIGATTAFSILLILIITGTIVGTVVTVYILGFTDSKTNIELKDTIQSFSSYVYTKDPETKEYKLAYKATPEDHNIRLSTDLSKLPEYVKYAFVCTEDERFYVHDGVDYKRTTAAVVNLALASLNMSDSYFGGSTITQQLVKNVTGHNENSWQRKMREIFTAMQLEKKYTKDDILQSYLNEIYFDQIDTYNMYGIEAASIGYFGKSASELTIAEAACLAAIPKAPNYYNLTDHYEDNMKRKEYCLSKMFELGIISCDEFDNAMNEKILVTNMPEFQQKYPDYKKFTKNTGYFENPDVNSYALDMGIMEFTDYLSETYNISSEKAMNMFKNGGYTLYLTVDEDMQSQLEEKYSDWYSYFPQPLSEDGEKVQSSFVVMDYKGHILATAGQIGPKEESFILNNAFRSHRQCGSTIKPVTTYGYALENDKITWSTMFDDVALPAGVAETEEWPQNYNGPPTGYTNPVQYFLKRSINTLPAQICHNYTLEAIYGFATKTLHLDLDPVDDMTYSSLAVGGTSTGPTLINLTNAYMPYGNGGKYYKASMISKVVDTNSGEVIIDNENVEGEQAVSGETSYVMNKLLQTVINESGGTGTSARLSNKEIAGKTGTTENWRDITFIGLTPDFVSGIWVGYPHGGNSDAIKNADSSRIWYSIFGEYADSYESDAEFPECDTVVYKKYCSKSGLIANDKCPTGGYGYYKSSNCAKCNIH